jgi:hypothetical protein
MERREKMNWSDAERMIQTTIIAGSTKILKCNGRERRAVTSNDGTKIGMRTGATTTQSKAISYEMLRHALEILQKKGTFDSTDFKQKFEEAYERGPCRYSMTGGVLVEIGAATLVSNEDESSCTYETVD